MNDYGVKETATKGDQTMNDYGVKETACTNCIHRKVCSLKTTFLKAQ